MDVPYKHLKIMRQNILKVHIPKYVNSMPENKSSLLTEENKNNLIKLTPKIHKILENLINEENIGLHLLYSNFEQLGGIGY